MLALEMTPTLAVPLHTDANGTVRVSNTRVTLETIVGFYLQGETPEELYEGFPTVPLADIYAVISYYLQHRAEVDAYIARQKAEGERIRQQWQAEFPSDPAFDERMRRLVAERRGKGQS